MNVTLRCFAAVRELVGQDELSLELAEGVTVGGLLDELEARFPGVRSIPLARAVNRSYVDLDHVLQEGDEVAFIPPISGGSGEAPRAKFEFCSEPLERSAFEVGLRSDADGAIVSFAGVTRDHHEGQSVEGLSYEAYEEMAVEVGMRLLESVLERHEIRRAWVQHRLGPVPIGEASVLIAVASAHRGPAFAACAEVMDRIKKEVPIFKRETLRSGDQRWVGDLPDPE